MRTSLLRAATLACALTFTAAACGGGTEVTAEAEEAMFDSILDAMSTCDVSLDSIGG